MKFALAILALIGVIFAACSDDSAQPTASASLVQSTPASSATDLFTVTFEGDAEPVEITVELADTVDERYQGLRNRQSLGENSGMLFAWPQDAQSAFGMPETYIALTIAFIREDGSIAHMEDMEPLSTEAYRSPEPYRFAIEANQGWFADNGIEIGDIADIPDTATAAAE